jgi:hypothetical protein
VRRTWRESRGRHCILWGGRKITNLKVTRQCPFAVLVKVGYKGGNMLVNEAGKSSGNGLLYVMDRETKFNSVFV